MTISWTDQYKHPMWQKKRLEALEVEGFKCANCANDQAQLQVHHKRYIKGRKIWEYEVEELEVLCGPCHEEAHALKDAIGAFFVAVPASSQNELFALMRGYAFANVGPFFDDFPPADEESGIPFALGTIAAYLQSFGLTTAETTAKALRERRRQCLPRATGIDDALDEVMTVLSRAAAAQRARFESDE